MGARDKRNPVATGLAALNRLAGLPLLDRLGARKTVESAVFHAARGGFTAAGAATRVFTRARHLSAPVRPAPAAGTDLFDLTPTDEQRLILDTVREFAGDQLRPVAAPSDERATPPRQLLARAGELGITLVNVPDELGGVAAERSTVTNVLVAEALAHGDLGLAVAILAPTAVANALVLWGDADQQSRYLPAFVTDTPPAAAFAVAEPRALFDPCSLATTAYRSGDAFVLTGAKSFVPRVNEDELFLLAAELQGRGPALFLVESAADGLSVEADPSMGLRAAGLGKLHLDRVRVPSTALLGAGEPRVYAEAVRLSRLGWAALATGTAQAVLDYVIPYVNQRQAFGEPISNRQGVAFMVSDIGTELEGMRLATYRAAARAGRGLPHAREVALARRLAADKGMAIGSDGVALLGGHGYVKDHPVERWYRDLRAIGIAEGGVLV